jgi:predicted GNAT family acetyltransferase
VSEVGGFPRAVTEFWLRGVPLSARRDRVHVVVDATLREARSVSLMTVVDGPRVLALSPVKAHALGFEHGQQCEPERVVEALEHAGVTLNDPDEVFHLTTEQARRCVEEPAPDGVRALTAADRAEFDRLISEAPDEDADEAFVALDHWLVFGRFVDDRLVSAASMYPWDDSSLADTGVLTLPAYRGHGHGAATVRAMCARALRLGVAPLYRCQADNVASLALARAAGLSPVGRWEVILPPE